MAGRRKPDGRATPGMADEKWIRTGRPLGDYAVLSQKIAEVIAGQNPLNWLVYSAEMTILWIDDEYRKDVNRSNRGANRADLSKRIKAIQKASDLIAFEIENYDMVNALDEAAYALEGLKSASDSFGDTRQSVKWLSRIAMDTLVNMRQGRGRDPTADGKLSPRATVALLVFGLWTEARGTPPPITNDTAQLACEMLWSAATGLPSRTGGDENDIGSWKTHLTKAKAIVVDAGVEGYEFRPLGCHYKLVRRFLNEGKKRAADIVSEG